MLDRRPSRRILVIAFALSGTFAAVCVGSEFLAEPTWKPIPAQAVRTQLVEYLQTTKVDATKQAEVLELWRTFAGDDAENSVLDRLAQCVAKTDERVANLVEFCSAANKPGQKLPEFPWLADSETPLLIRSNMRVYLARWLVQQGYYDEGVAWTDGLETDDVVAPEALLFYRAIALQQLVQPAKAHSALAQLMQQQDKLPTRYQKLADLMKHDLTDLQDESLDHVSRRMNDIRRRLAQGRSGERVQGVEKSVIDSLDKLIKKAESQCQQQAAAAAAKSGQAQSSAPMQDSQIAEGKGPGKVERKDLGRGVNWGNLNERDREKAVQEIGREFPSHYREVIEEYFRRLAAEDSADKP